MDLEADMQSSNEENEVFFDSTAEFLLMEDSCGGKEERGYEMWTKEPQSIKKRRESFLRGMGLSEFASQKVCEENVDTEVGTSLNLMGLERLTECSGAVSSCSYSPTSMFENLEDRNKKETEFSSSSPELVHGQAEAGGEEDKSFDERKIKLKSWWKSFMSKSRAKTSLYEEFKLKSETPKRSRINVKQNKKKCMELSALYYRQNFRAHEGSVWTMAFSPDGQFLASGGEDGIIRVWRVSYNDALGNFLTPEGNLGRKVSGKKKNFLGTQTGRGTVMVPERLFQIKESPVQEFHGHSSDVLDLAWTNSTCLLSSSMDKTVRLWKVGCNSCLNIFRHNDYVTCIQLNPVDENYFISGSVDGKIRIWGVKEKQVVDWIDIRDIITAISYQPNGKGFIVGSITGNCRFYTSTDDYLQLDGQINIQGKKKGLGKRITGIQFSRENSQRVMITSEDSKVYIFEGLDIIHKYKGLPKSGSQMWGSFTPTEKHIVSIGNDSRVYIWNNETVSFPACMKKRRKTITSCEHFFSEGVSVAIPWKGHGSKSGSFRSSGDDPNSSFSGRDSENSLFGNWLFVDGLSKGSATWPEEKLLLPQWNSPGEDISNSINPVMWGLVIVGAGLDGTIRTFHNYGLPVKL